MIVRIKLPKALLRPASEDSDQGPCRRRRRAGATDESSAAAAATRKRKRESTHSTATLMPFLVPVGGGGKALEQASDTSNADEVERQAPKVTKVQKKKRGKEEVKEEQKEAAAPTVKIVLKRKNSAQQEQQRQEQEASVQAQKRREERTEEEAEKQEGEEEEVMHTTPQATKRPRKKTRARKGSRRGAAKLLSRGKREVSPTQAQTKEEEEEKEECPLVVSTVTGGHTDVGGRGENQDSYFWLTEDEEKGGARLPCCAWGVLDGHGTNGATASATATRVIKQHLLDAFRKPQARSMTADRAKALLSEAFQFVLPPDAGVSSIFKAHVLNNQTKQTDGRTRS